MSLERPTQGHLLCLERETKLHLSPLPSTEEGTIILSRPSCFTAWGLSAANSLDEFIWNHVGRMFKTSTAKDVEELREPRDAMSRGQWINYAIDVCV